MTTQGHTRRHVLMSAGVSLCASTFLRGQRTTGETPGRIAPLAELVNALEFEEMAQRKLDSLTFSQIAGSERSAFERITFRPRLMVDSRELETTTELFEQKLFAPILVGPTSQQKRFHPEGELAMVRGASAAKALVVVADRSSYPIHEIAAHSKTTLWYQIYLEPGIDEIRSRIEKAVEAGCKAVCVTLTVAANPVNVGVDWNAIDRIRQGLKVPVLLKGVMSPEEAQKAVGMGLQGIVVSNYAVHPISGVVSPIEMLPLIADAVAGKIPVLIDGSFRRGSDILKALALGANAVLLGRPALWGLGAYGAEGVQRMVELLQTELARDMAMCGKTTIKSIDRTVVKIHRR